jgi:hypothetical protein
LNGAFVSQDLKNQVNTVCNWTAAAINAPNALSAQCLVSLGKASQQIGHIDTYNVYGDWLLFF